MGAQQAARSQAALRQARQLEMAVARGARRAAMANANSERSQRILAMQHGGADGDGDAAKAMSCAQLFGCLESGNLPSQAAAGKVPAPAMHGQGLSAAISHGKPRAARPPMLLANARPAAQAKR